MSQNGNSGPELPRENLIRATFPADLDIREEPAGDGKASTLYGHFARFNEWTEIRSLGEGHFMERLAPGAFAKTIVENRRNMRVLFQHGRDPQIGDKVLGSIRHLQEDGDGVYYEVALHDTTYNRDLEPGLKAGDYGASFRFKVIREEVDLTPERSDWNPDAIPQRTIVEAAVKEFGPVTFPAYDGATAAVRSLTVNDEGLLVVAPDGMSRIDPEVVETAPDEAAPSHPADEPRRDTQPEDAEPQVVNPERKVVTMGMEEQELRATELEAKLQLIATENTGRSLDQTTQAEWDQAVAELDGIRKALEDTRKRQAEIERLLNAGIVDGETVVPGRPSDGTGTYIQRHDGKSKLPDDRFDMAAYKARSSSWEQELDLYYDGARSVMETFHYPHPDAERDRVNTHLERMLHEADGPDKELAQRLLIHGSPAYRSAYWKTLMRQPLNSREQQAMQAGLMLEARSITTAQTGGVTVPIQIDPTVIPVSNGVLNPIRAISRIITTTSHQWQGVTSAGVSATRRAEGAAMADNSPTFNTTPIVPTRVDVFIPFSWEAAADWGGLERDMAQLISDAKDIEEANAFATGSGTTPNPRGVLIGASTQLGTNATVTLGTTDLLALQDALPPRFQPNASWLMAPATTSRVRALTTSAQGSWWAQSLQAGVPSQLLGYPAYKASSVGTGGGALPPLGGAKWGIIGDFNYYAVVDRVGLQTRYIDNLFSGNTAGAFGYPVGMSGIVAYYRNGADILTSNAFRVGTIT